MSDAAQHVIKPFELVDNGVVFVSSGIAETDRQYNQSLFRLHYGSLRSLHPL